jgi:putative salt-induced outer membrane protein YdiY
MLGVAFAARADLLELKNGDRLSGALTGAEDGHIVWETPYAGAVRVPAGMVRRVVLDEAASASRPQSAAVRDVLDRHDVPVVGPEEGSGDDAEASESGSDADTGKESAFERGWSGSVDVGGTWRAGETDRVDASLGATLEYRWARDVLTLKASSSYAEVDGEVNTRAYGGSARLQHYVRDRLFVYGRLAAEHDPGRRLELRLEAGGGVGYDVIRNDRRTLSLDAGLGYFRERWNRYTLAEVDEKREQAREQRLARLTDLLVYLRGLRARPVADWTLTDLQRGIDRALAPLRVDLDQETTADEYANVRFEAVFEQRLFERSRVTESLSVRAPVDHLEAYLLTSELALETPLNENLSLRLNWLAEYDAQKRVDADGWDSRVQLSMRYAF